VQKKHGDLGVAPKHAMPLKKLVQLGSTLDEICVSAKDLVVDALISSLAAKFEKNGVLVFPEAVSHDDVKILSKKVDETSMNIRKKKVDYTGSLRPHPQSPQVVVDPDTVLAFPDYALDGVPKTKGCSQIEIKTAQDIECMRAAGRAAREVLDIAGRMVKAGITADEIDKAVHAACLERKAYPSPLNYRKFPKSCCTSVNEVICHGIPDSRPLKSGDIINIDNTVCLNGYHGDCSEMFVVGGKEALDEKGRTLIQTTYDSWISAMEVVKPGVDYNTIVFDRPIVLRTRYRKYVSYGSKYISLYCQSTVGRDGSGTRVYY